MTKLDNDKFISCLSSSPPGKPQCLDNYTWRVSFFIIIKEVEWGFGCPWKDSAVVM